MTPERWERIKQLFELALERDPRERSTFLQKACADDAGLFAEVEALLAEHDKAAGFIESPPWRLAASRVSAAGDLKSCPECRLSFTTSHRFCPKDGARLSISDPYHLVGRTLAGRYRIDALVGIGGMGAVYSARHMAIDRKVALKILQPNIALVNQRVSALFQREARASGRLVHENIAAVYDAGRSEDGIAYIAMEWLDGRTLDEELSMGGRFSLKRAAEVIRQIAAALGVAHEAQIIHRDLKPSNVMLIRKGDGGEQVKVLDFGIAKILSDSTDSAASVVIGTPNYASPEQLSQGQVIDRRCDIYSLGVILYQMLTGVLPHQAPSLQELIVLKLTEQPRPPRDFRPEIPSGVERLLVRVLDKDPHGRPGSAEEVSRLLSQALESYEVPVGEKLRLQTTTDLQGEPTHEAAEISEEANPLLSEFDFSPRLHNWLVRHPGGGTLAGLAALGGLAAAIMSKWVGSGCVRVILQAVPSKAQHVVLFGYLAEPNAALWYIFGVPVFVIVAMHFLNLADSALREFSEADRLIAFVPAHGEVRASALKLIGERNRRLFRFLTPAILLFAIAAVCVPEYSSSGRQPFGWVDSLSIKNYEGIDLQELEKQKMVGAIPGVDQLCRDDPNCRVVVAKVEGGHGLSDRRDWLYPFAVFLSLSLGLQILFTAFALWVAAKIVFFFLLLAKALVNRHRPGLKFALDFEDTEMRFGLGALDIVHNAVLLLVLVVSVAFILQRVTNIAKGTSFFSGMTGLNLAGQLGVFLSPLILLVLVILLPMLVFIILIETQMGKRIQAIEKERAFLKKEILSEHQKERIDALEGREEALRGKRDLARQQRLWPRKSPVYRTLLVATFFCLVVLPFVIEYADLWQHGAFSKVTDGLAHILCYIF